MMPFRSRPSIPLFAALGAVSGVLSVLILQLKPYWYIAIAAEMHVGLWPPLVVPGMMFGFVIGLALLQGGWASPAAFAGYVAAATLCNFAAVTLAEGLMGIVGSGWITGILAGLIGSAGLTVCALVLLPVARRRKPLLRTVLTGGAFGALLGPAMATDGPLWWFVFFALWQAGYAASLAAAMRRR